MIDLNDVKQLLTQTDERTLSLYVAVNDRLQENQNSFPAWDIWVRNTLDEMQRTLTGDQAEAWPYIRQWVEDYLRGYSADSRSLVIFAGPSHQQAFELPIAFENQAHFGKPQVIPLLWAIDEYEPYLITLIDQEKARFFVSYLGSVGFQQGVDIDIDDYDFVERTSSQPPGQPDRGNDTGFMPHGGSAREDFQDMINEHRARFYRDVVQHIEQLMARHKVKRLVLGGSEDSASEIRKYLPKQLEPNYVGFVPVPMRTPTQEIQEKVLPLAQEFERKDEYEIVDQVINLAKAGGRGALGEAAVREAMDMQRVELLVLLWPPLDEEMASDLAYQALQLNSGIEMVHGDAGSLLHSEGGIAARLYYAL